MEGIEEQFFKVKYNAKVDRLQVTKPKWTSRFLEKLRKHKIISGVLILFILFSAIDFFLISNFMKIMLAIDTF